MNLVVDNYNLWLMVLQEEQLGVSMSEDGVARATIQIKKENKIVLEFLLE